MKNCPFCAEQIQDQAIKCRYCGEFLDKSLMPQRNQPRGKWYYSMHSVVLAILFFGPLALPLVWFNPKYKMITKIIVTVVVIGITIWMTILMKNMYTDLSAQLRQLGMY